MGSQVNSEADDSLPFLSPNEHILYFHSTRPGGCGVGTGDIWMTRRRNKHSDWEPPTNLGCVLNTSANETAPAYFEDPETEQAWLFYASDRTDRFFDVYASPLGEDGSVGLGLLVPAFSSPGRDTRIFIRKDGLEAFITSNRIGSLNGSLDIWVSTRDTLADPWSAPTNPGMPVNSVVDDVAPWLSKDGTTLYFSSNRFGGHGLRDLWYTTRTKLKD
jgi:WD40-like Beta Propeller Repeat